MRKIAVVAVASSTAPGVWVTETPCLYAAFTSTSSYPAPTVIQGSANRHWGKREEERTVTDVLATLGQHRKELVIEETERVFRIVQVVDDGEVGVFGVKVFFEFFAGFGGQFL